MVPENIFKYLLNKYLSYHSDNFRTQNNKNIYRFYNTAFVSNIFVSENKNERNIEILEQIFN